MSQDHDAGYRLLFSDPRWQPGQLTELLPRLPAFLKRLQPQMGYVLIDEGAVPEEQLLRLGHNLAAIIFRIEQPASPEAVKAAVDELIAATAGADYQPLRRTLSLWLRAVLRRNTKYPILLDEVDDLGEMKAMLSEAIEQWAMEFQAQGREEGLEEGLEKGREEGRRAGQVDLLSRLLVRRFGDVPAWAEARLQAASTAQLATWSEAVFDARSLAEVFVEH